MARFMLRIGKLSLELMALLLAGALLLGLFAFWRIGRGPVDIAFLTPHIARALNDLLPTGMSLSVGNVEMSWDSKGDVLDFRARDLRLDEEASPQSAHISQLGFSLSLRHLLLGQARLTGISLYRPQLHVLRQPDGRIGFALAKDGQSTAPSESAAALLSTLLQPPSATASSPIALLRKVAISDAALSITDEAMGLSWQVPQASLVVERTPEGLVATGDLDLVLGEQVIPLRMAAKTGGESSAIQTTFSFSGLDPTLLVPLHETLLPLSNLSLPLSGTISTTLDAHLSPISADLVLAGGSGTINLPELYPAPLPINAFSLAASLDIPARQASLQQLAIDLGGPMLRATGTLSRRDGSWHALLDTGAENVAIDSLATWWPPTIGVSAREWVLECLSSGTAHEARASFSLSAPEDHPQDIALEDISGQIAFSGVTVDYLPPMPAVSRVSGTARFDHDSFNITVDGGILKDITAGKSLVNIGGLSGDSEHITLDITLDGTLPAIIRAIDGEPLDLAKGLGLRPSDIAGRAAGTLRLAFPLKKDLSVSDIAVSSSARLTDTSLSSLIGDWPLTRGAFDLSLNNKGMRATGSALIHGVPATGTWEESFSDATVPTRVDFKAILSENDRRRMGLDVIPRLSGSIGIDGTVTRASNGNATLAGALNLGPATISAPGIGLSKPAGADGTASFLASFHEGRLEKVGNIRLNTDTIDATGEARIARDGSLAALDIENLSFLRSRLKAKILPLEKEGWSVSISGDALDLAPFLEGGESPAGSSDPLSATIQIAFDVGTTFDRDGKLFDRFKGRIDLEGDRVSSADAAGTLGPHRLTLSFRPDEGQRHRLRLEMTDAGTFLMASDILGTVRGGRLVLDGRSRPRPAPNAPLILDGALEMKDFVLVNTPVLARILNALSLPGFLELLGNEGFRFNQLYADFTYAPDKIDIREGRAAGASLGITFAGTLDRKKSVLDVGGIVIPVHGINSVLQAIPLLGTLLTGGEGGGLIAATYKISGSTKDPKTSVNPLSILMPGFLRSLFFPEEGSRLLPNTPPRKP